MKVIHAYFKVNPEKRSVFLEKVKPLIQASQTEEGNISYRLFEDTEDPNAFIMVEQWKDQEAIDFHFQTTHFNEFDSVEEECLAEPVQVDIFNVTK